MWSPTRLLSRLAAWRPGPAHLVSALALFIALGGTAVATHPGGANTISSGDIINGEVKSVDIANAGITSDDMGPNSVGSAKITDREVKNQDLSLGASSSNTIADGGIQGIDVKNDTLTGTQIAELTLDAAVLQRRIGDTCTAGHAIREIAANGTVTCESVGAAGSFWSLAGNAGTTSSTDFLGTTDNQPLSVRVNNARALRLEPASDGVNESPNVIGGIADNSVAGAVFGATIAGGARLDSADPATANRVNDSTGTIGGGAGNRAGVDDADPSNQSFATVGGGRNNTASALRGTVGGGNTNTASGISATVGGGGGNTASGGTATVGGGGGNTASGLRATVPGGGLNTAAGNFSFAAGNRAKADHHGAFVWGDSTADDVSSTEHDQFTARAAGGVRLFSSPVTTGVSAPGVQLFPGTSALGTLSTTDPFDIRVAIGAASDRGLRIAPAFDGTNQSPNVIGGIADNSVAGGVFGATIAGGARLLPADPSTANRVNDNTGTIGGGANNRAGVNDLDPSNQGYATVGGGLGNTASGAESTVGGGAGNVASGADGTVGGGGSNTASGLLATVPGGDQNTAAADWSFAAGRRAKANDQGAFVWGDSTDADVSSTAPDQFIARAAGRFFLQSDSTLDDQGGFINTSTGAFLSTGGEWTNNSDRRLKNRFAKLQPSSVLRKLTRLPVHSWSYKAEPGVRHIGPVAQDFHRLFRVGADNRHIGSVDSAGVALAAIKALAVQNRRQGQRIARLERRLAALKATP